jgi:hypothetical protein
LVIGAATLKASVVWRRPVVEGAVRELGFPVDATTWISERDPPGQLYNPYRWGGYLIWRLFPEQAVFVDGRADMYGDSFLIEYTDLASAAPGWEDTLGSHEVCTALVEVAGPLSDAMVRSPDWEHVYEDETAAIYFHSSDGCSAVDRSNSREPDSTEAEPLPYVPSVLADRPTEGRSSLGVARLLRIKLNLARSRGTYSASDVDKP